MVAVCARLVSGVRDLFRSIALLNLSSVIDMVARVFGQSASERTENGKKQELVIFGGK